MAFPLNHSTNSGRKDDAAISYYARDQNRQSQQPQNYYYKTSSNRKPKKTQYFHQQQQSRYFRYDYYNYNQPRRYSTSIAQNSVYMGNVPFESNEDDIRHLLRNFDSPQSIVIKNQRTGKNAYAFLEFSNPESAQALINSTEEYYLFNSRIAFKHRYTDNYFIGPPAVPTGPAVKIAPSREDKESEEVTPNVAIEEVEETEEIEQTELIVRSQTTPPSPSPSSSPPSPPPPPPAPALPSKPPLSTPNAPNSAPTPISAPAPSSTSTSSTYSSSLSVENSSPLTTIDHPSTSSVSTCDNKNETGQTATTNLSCPGSVLRVAGIPEQWNPQTLFDVFSSYNKIDSAFIYNDKDEYGKRQGLVQMKTKESAILFCQDYQMLMVGNIILQIFTSELSSTRDVFSYIDLSTNHEKNYYSYMTKADKQPKDDSNGSSTSSLSLPPPPLSIPPPPALPHPSSNHIVPYSPIYPYPIPQQNHWQLPRSAMYSYPVIPPFLGPDGMRIAYPTFPPYYPNYPVYQENDSAVTMNSDDNSDHAERMALRYNQEGGSDNQPSESPGNMTSLVSGTDNCRLYVKNLDAQIFTNSNDFKRLFMEFGKIKTAKLCHSRDRPYPTTYSKPQKLFGFIEYFDHRSALNALVRMNGFQVGCFHVSVEFAYSTERFGRVGGGSGNGGGNGGGNGNGNGNGNANGNGNPNPNGNPNGNANAKANANANTNANTNANANTNTNTNPNDNSNHTGNGFTNHTSISDTSEPPKHIIHFEGTIQGPSFPGGPKNQTQTGSRSNKNREARYH